MKDLYTNKTEKSKTIIFVWLTCYRADSVTNIGQGDFGWCTSLTSVTIPDAFIPIKDVGY